MAEDSDSSGDANLNLNDGVNSPGAESQQFHVDSVINRIKSRVNKNSPATNIRHEDVQIPN